MQSLRIEGPATGIRFRGVGRILTGTSFDKAPAACIRRRLLGEGNSGPLRLDDNSGVDEDNYDADCDAGKNSGASEYNENIKNGSDCVYAPNDKVDTKPGNNVGPTCQAFGELLSGNTDALTDVYGGLENGVYTLVDTTSPRFAIVPVVDVPPNSHESTTVTIKRFITVYIKGACQLEGGPGGEKQASRLYPSSHRSSSPGSLSRAAAHLTRRRTGR